MAVSYHNWRGRLVEVSDETLAAVLDALEDERCPAAAKAPVAGMVAPFPHRRSWGFAIQQIGRASCRERVYVLV